MISRELHCHTSDLLLWLIHITVRTNRFLRSHLQKKLLIQSNPAITDFKGPEYFIRYCRIPLLPIWLCFEKNSLKWRRLCTLSNHLFGDQKSSSFHFWRSHSFFSFFGFFSQRRRSFLSRACNCYRVHATVIACTQRLSKFLKLFRQIRITAGLILSSTWSCWEKNPCLFFFSALSIESAVLSLSWHRDSESLKIETLVLSHSLARSLASLTHYLAPNCLLWSRALLRLFARSFAPELMGQLNMQVQFSGCSE